MIDLQILYSKGFDDEKFEMLTEYDDISLSELTDLIIKPSNILDLDNDFKQD